MIKFPVYRPSLAGKEREYVVDCIESSWISSKGKYVERFEDSFADYMGVAHAASVCNGTVALHVALLALGIGPGDEVIVPTLTYIASVNAITYTGAVAVFADSVRDTWQLNPEDVEKRITPRTKAVMVVHLYGHPCDMDAFGELARKHGLYLIEDCAEAIGSEYHGRKVGTFGDIACFSFFGNKTVTTGEGGMVATFDRVLDEKVRHLKGQGLMQGREYWHDAIGYNYRMTNICAALGCAQLERVEEIVQQKRRVANTYRDALQDVPVEFHKESTGVSHTYWMCSMLVPRAQQRDSMRARLAAAGIETRPLFPPVHLMPIYPGGPGEFPVAEALASRGINLPSYPDLSNDDIGFIADTIKEVLRDQAGHT